MKTKPILFAAAMLIGSATFGAGHAVTIAPAPMIAPMIEAQSLSEMQTVDYHGYRHRHETRRERRLHRARERRIRRWRNRGYDRGRFFDDRDYNPRRRRHGHDGGGFYRCDPGFRGCRRFGDSK